VSAPRALSAEAVTPGMDLGPVVFGPLDRADITRYAHASGDLNPIHLDDERARAAGAPSVFAMGLLPAGHLAHALCDWVGGPQRLRRLRVRFTARVWPGDELVCRGRVDSLRGDVVTVALEVRRRGPGPEGLDLSREEVALVGEAEARLTG
jgi:acyl dehydratase